MLRCCVRKDTFWGGTVKAVLVSLHALALDEVGHADAHAVRHNSVVNRMSKLHTEEKCPKREGFYKL